MSKIQELINREGAKLYGSDYKTIQKLISPAIGIKLKKKEEIKKTVINSNSVSVKSKIGGFPNIGKDVIWPTDNGLSLTFLCQINLSDLSGFTSELPSSGILYFFIANREAEDFIQLENAIKVIFREDHRINPEFNTTESNPLDEYDIAFYEHYTLPSYQEKRRLDHSAESEILDDIEDLELYIPELTYGHYGFTNHHMLGDPNALQGSVRMFWAAKVQYPEDIHYEGLMEYLDEVLKVGEDFILLLQIDFEDERIALPNYADQCLYFGILKKDLTDKNFENVKLVIQRT